MENGRSVQLHAEDEKMEYWIKKNAQGVDKWAKAWDVTSGSTKK